MKLLLINPCLRRNNPRKFMPMGLLYIATAIRQAGYEFDLLDLDLNGMSDVEVERYLRNHPYDVVAFGCLVTAYPWVRSICALIKTLHPRTTIIVGNSVASSIPDLLLTRTAADIAVLGEGDITVIEILEALTRGTGLAGIAGIAYREAGRVIRNPRRAPIKNLDTLPVPDRSLFDVEQYLAASPDNVQEPFPVPRESIRTLNLNSARGCPFQCTFCYHVFKGTPFRARSPRSIVGEMTELVARYGINYVQFWDELTFYSKRQIEEFIAVLEPARLEISFSGSTMAGVLGPDDLALAQRLKEVGCVLLGFSIESGAPAILKRMRKQPDHLEKFSATRRVLQQAKIATGTSLVFGYPEETPETIRQTVEFCLREKVAPSAGFLLVQPGTPMYDYAVERGLITDEEAYLLTMGDRQDLHLNLTAMPDEELVAAVTDGMKRCQQALGIVVANPLKTGQQKSADEI